MYIFQHHTYVYSEGDQTCSLCHAEVSYFQKRRSLTPSLCGFANNVKPLCTLVVPLMRYVTLPVVYTIFQYFFIQRIYQFCVKLSVRQVKPFVVDTCAAGCSFDLLSGWFKKLTFALSLFAFRLEF